MQINKLFLAVMAFGCAQSLVANPPAVAVLMAETAASKSTGVDSKQVGTGEAMHAQIDELRADVTKLQKQVAADDVNKSKAFSAAGELRLARADRDKCMKGAFRHYDNEMFGHSTLDKLSWLLTAERACDSSYLAVVDAVQRHLDNQGK